MIEPDRVYNCDCLDLMREMAGGGKGRLAHNRPAVWDRH